MATTTSSDRWTPKLGSVVRFRPQPDRPADEAPPPPGTWKLISRNDRGAAHWWALALDTDARAWAAAHPGSVESGCVDADGADLVPPHGIRF